MSAIPMHNHVSADIKDDGSCPGCNYILAKLKENEKKDE